MFNSFNISLYTDISKYSMMKLNAASVKTSSKLEYEYDTSQKIKSDQDVWMKAGFYGVETVLMKTTGQIKGQRTSVHLFICSRP